MTINKTDIKNISYFLFGGIIIFLIHFLIIRAFPDKLETPGILLIHPFLFAITIIVIIAINIILKKTKANIMGYAFMGSSLIKMLALILFLLPIIIKPVEYRLEYIVQFFMIYFIYLIMEVVYLVCKIKKG
jgi:hypothetical protein